MVVVLPLKETPWQCSQYGEWTHKKKNYAKWLKCFYYSSDKHDASNYNYTEEKYKNSLKTCPQLPKCIVYNRPYTIDFEYHPLKSGYSKPKESIKRLDRADVSQIHEQ